MSAGAGRARPDLAVATVAAKSYLPFARVLARSFRERHPQVPFFLLLADEPQGCFDPAAEPFEMVRLADVGIPRLRRFLFQYTRREVAVALKAYLLGHLLERGFRRALFLDADVWVTGDLVPLFAALERSAILLTPHLLAPLDGPAAARRELAIVRAGSLNAGLVGVADDPDARRFLGWWQERLATHCRLAPRQGLHHDQGWLALVAGGFRGVEIVRDPGANVAYWNLAERGLDLVDGEPRVQGQTVRFLHFSGFDPDRPERLTRHSNEPAPPRPAAVVELCRRYAEALAAAGWRESRSWPYAYGKFDDGSAIPEVARSLYRGLGEGAEAFGDPFATAAAGCFADWLVPSDARALARTPLWAALLERRPDVRAVFPDPAGADRGGFLRWARSSGAREHGLAARFLPAPPAQ